MRNDMVLKVGDDFEYVGYVKILDEQDAVVEFTGWVIESVVTTLSGLRRKIPLNCTWEDTVLGKFRLHGETGSWPPGSAQIYVKFTSPLGGAVTTPTTTFTIVKD